MSNPSLRHVYANLAEANDTLTAGGGALLANDAANNARKLEILNEVSRLIDTKAHRGTGFGPWVGTRYYDGDSRTVLWLRADLADLDELTISDVESVVDTDFHLAGLGEYDEPFRKIILHGQGSPTRFATGKRTIAITGTWSYPYVIRPLTTTTGEAIDEDETTFDVSGLDEISPGMTIRIGDEQMYVYAVTPETESTADQVSVERGVNGTTAESHGDTAEIMRYVYASSVHTLALRLFEKRWKARDAGADGIDGGNDVGFTSLKEGEDTIIRRMLGPVRLVGQV